MISGIVPIVNAKGMGIPYLLAIEAWAEVCDEIVVVTKSDDLGLQEMVELSERLSERCVVKIRGITRPTDFEVYRDLGYSFLSEPDWVVHFDGDYLISPTEAKKLRESILSAPLDTDILTYVLVYLNYDAKSIFKTEEMEKWWPPHDGFRAEFPFVLNMKRGMVISPYEGLTEDGKYVNMESVLCFHPDKWGKTFNTKFMNHNPYQFNIVRSGVEAEHLTWSMNLERAKKKADEENRVGGGVGWDKVRDGDGIWDVSYPILDSARKMYELTEPSSVSAFDGDDSEFIAMRRKNLTGYSFEVFIDIGPGYPDSEAWVIRELYPDVRIIGFEANPENYKRLIDSGYPGELHNIAVADKCCTMTFYEIQKGDLSLFSDSDDNPAIEIEAESLDSLSKRFGPFEKAFIWADIEGGELAMLEGASGLFNDGKIVGVNLEVRNKPYADGWCSADQVALKMAEYDFEISNEYGHVTGYVDYNDVIYIPKNSSPRIKAIILHHNKPKNTDKLAEQLKECFEVEVWDSGSDSSQIPMSLTESFGNIYWEGAWQEAMNRYSDYDAVWLLGCDIVLKNSPQEYKDSLEKLISYSLGCWSPSVDGRAHPFMLEKHYDKKICSVQNIEGMAMAVSGKLIRAIGGKFELHTEKGFGQDYWFCAMARRNKLVNYIDGSISVIHPPEIGYNEMEAHDLMEEAFSKAYGKDFRKTLFEYNENFKENLLEENIMEVVRGNLADSLVIATVDNGWGVKEFEEITSQFPQCRRIIMCKGVSDFSSETSAEVINYDENLTELLNADIVLFARIGSANKEEYLKVLEAGIPVIVKEGYDDGKIVHEKNGFIYGHESWGSGWIRNLINDEGLRLRIGGKAAHDNKTGEMVTPVVEEKAIETSVKPDHTPLVTIITPTFRRDPRVVSHCLDCVRLQTYTRLEQLVCSDGSPEPPIASLVGSIGDERISYHHTTVKKPGDFGNVVRSEMLAKARGDYILFLDDDNIILPNYLETMIKAIEESGKDFAVCRVVHFGPLNEEKYGKKPPVVLTGLPVKLYHVDPLQILVKKNAMQDIGWDTDKGYLADGHTLQALGDKFEHVEVPQVLGFHM